MLITATRSVENGAESDLRLYRRLCQAGVALLVAVGMLVLLLGVWLSSPRSEPPVEHHNNLPFDAWILQPLVSGNLAICLLWVWLDQMAIRFCNRNAGIRDAFLQVMLLMVLVTTVSCLCLAGVQGNDQAFAIALFITLPVLVVAVPLLWLVMGRMASLAWGALLLAGFAVASGIAQQRASVEMDAGEDASLFVANSYLIGLAVAIWLLSWTAVPHAEESA